MSGSGYLFGGKFMSKLVICEKYSQAQGYSAVLGANDRNDGFFTGNGYIVAYCVGHLLELAAPEVYDEKYAKWRYADLPIIPDKWLHTPLKSKISQLKILKDLMNRADVDCVINACDAGREGELIFRLVYEYAKCNKKIFRAWLSSMEDSAIKAAFDNLKDGADYNKLYAAASCRERADWCVGVSATRAFSCLYGATLNVGRVQSPTLAMLVRREADISMFLKEPFYTPTLDLSGFTASGDKHKNKFAADEIAAACNGQTATVINVERVTKTVNPPKLYDLTTLQRDANRLLGFTAQQTLEYAQSLYEKKTLSYPRTDAKYITADMRDTVLKILGDVGFTPDVDRIIGSVSDHHAVITTLESRNADTSALPGGEREIFELVRKRLVAAVSPKHVYEAVTVTLDCGGNIFTAKGKTVIESGWKTQSETEENDDGESDSVLPELSKGQTFDSIKITVKEGVTSPPKHFTEDTLLSSMDTAGAEDMPEDAERLGVPPMRAGLGTPTTRAAIIEKLIKSGFVERSKKNLLPTDKGKNLIAVLPASLTSAKLTAEWEHKLKQVERGELGGDEFMAEIAGFIKTIVAENTAPKPEFILLFPKKESGESLGCCPRCKSAVREGTKGFFCDNRECGFKVWRESKFWTAKKKPLTAEIVAVLLKSGRVKLTGLFSEKTSKKYDATVVLDDTGNGFVNFKLEFDK